MVWNANKVQVFDKAVQGAKNVFLRADTDAKKHVESMIESAHETWLRQAQSTPNAGVDPDLVCAVCFVAAPPATSSSPLQFSTWYHACFSWRQPNV